MNFKHTSIIKLITLSSLLTFASGSCCADSYMSYDESVKYMAEQEAKQKEADEALRREVFTRQANEYRHRQEHPEETYADEAKQRAYTAAQMKAQAAKNVSDVDDLLGGLSSGKTKPDHTYKPEKRITLAPPLPIEKQVENSILQIKQSMMTQDSYWATSKVTMKFRFNSNGYPEPIKCIYADVKTMCDIAEINSKRMAENIADHSSTWRNVYKNVDVIYNVGSVNIIAYKD